MRSVSDAFASILAGSHEVAATVAIFYAGEPVFDDLPIVSGSLTVDSTQAVQGALEVAVPRWFTTDDGTVLDLLPTTPGPSINCEGTQLALSYLVGLPGEGHESLGLGWFRIDEWAEEDGTITVRASSLEALIQEARFLNPYTTKKGTTYAAAVEAIVDDLVPLVITADTTQTVGSQTFEDDRLEALRNLATAWPARAYVDDSGTLVFGPPLDDEDDPVVGSLTDGINGTVVQAPATGNRDGIYNAVKASGEASGDVAPVSAVVYLRDGPRRWNGPYGNVPYFYTSPLLTTRDAARKAATTRLANLQVRAEPLEIEAAPDPRWETGDLLSLVAADATRLVRVDGYRLPLTADAGAMSIQAHVVESLG